MRERCYYPGCMEKAEFLVQFELSYRWDECINACFCEKHKKIVERVKNAYDNSSGPSFGRLTVYTAKKPHKQISTRS